MVWCVLVFSINEDDLHYISLEESRSLSRRVGPLRGVGVGVGDRRRVFHRRRRRIIAFFRRRRVVLLLLRTVSRPVTFLAAASALVVWFWASTIFFRFRSRVRLGAVSRPVTDLPTAVAHVLGTSHATFARRSRTSAASAAAVLRACSRVVTESTAYAARIVFPSGKSASSAVPASIRRRTKSRHVAKPAASVASNVVHPRPSSIRHRAVSRPVAKVAASVAPIVRRRPSGVAATFVIVPSRAASVVIRTVASPVVIVAFNAKRKNKNRFDY